jgi:hypothetical protein
MVGYANFGGSDLTVRTALLAQGAKREGRLSQLVYLEQEDEDD